MQGQLDCKIDFLVIPTGEAQKCLGNTQFKSLPRPHIIAVHESEGNRGSIVLFALDLCPLSLYGLLSYDVSHPVEESLESFIVR